MIPSLPTDSEYLEMLLSAPKPMTAEWLRSPAYDLLMDRHYLTPDMHEASKSTRSYVFRHATAASCLGAWRWRGMQLNRERLLRIIERAELCVDFGGAACPLGVGSVVVDIAMTDQLGRKVPYGTLSQLPGHGIDEVDVIFSSHALEHVYDLDKTLWEMAQALRPGGHLLLLVPSCHCERWRVGRHKAADHGDHRWDFGLELEAPPDVPLVAYTNVAVAVATAGFSVEHAGYCGDDSIMVVARRA